MTFMASDHSKSFIPLSGLLTVAAGPCSLGPEGEKLHKMPSLPRPMLPKLLALQGCRMLHHVAGVHCLRQAFHSLSKSF